jgi:site-specific DNA-methyltransferase (adenine-specific)
VGNLYKIKNIKNTILQGHVLSLLKKIPNESVDLGITSPPYWGLRSYKTEPQVWGGCPDCYHEWVYETKKGISGGIKSKKVRTKGTENFQIVKDSVYGFCIKCNAWLGELGGEPTLQLYVSNLVSIFDEFRRILKPTGSLWVNISDTYAANRSYQVTGTKQVNGSQPMAKQPQAKDSGVVAKSLCGIPDRLKIAMIDNKWICRNEVIWHKPNQMPSSAKDRFTGDFEKFYWFTKSNKKYYFEQQLEEYVSEPNHNPRDKNSEKYNGTGLYSAGGRDYYSQGGRNKRTVWSINTKPYREAHFATFPPELIETPIIACSPEGGVVLDMFFGSGTTGLVAKKNGRDFVGIELNCEYIELAKKRLEINR